MRTRKKHTNERKKRNKRKKRIDWRKEEKEPLPSEQLYEMAIGFN